MKISKEWLEEKNACTDAIEAFENQKETDSYKILKILREQERYDWASWLMTRLMNHEQCVEYAVYAAELVLPIFEEEYPKNKAPRKAIEATKQWLFKKNREIIKVRIAANVAYEAKAADAVNAAYAASHTAYAAANAAYAAAYAANAAAYAADAANAVDAAANAAAYAAYEVDVACVANAAYAANAADGKDIYPKVLDYGEQILKGETNENSNKK